MSAKRFPWWACPVFVRNETVLPVGLPTAQARLVNLSRGPLARASQQSYDETITGLLLVGPLGPVPGLSRQVTDAIVHPPGPAGQHVGWSGSPGELAGPAEGGQQPG
jgi:hypothetical protein